MFLRRAADVFWRLAGRWRSLPQVDGAEGQALALDANQDLVWAGPFATSAIEDATYILVSSHPDLPNARTIAGEATVISITDTGAGGTVTIGVQANGITHAKYQQIAAGSLLGCAFGAPNGNVEAIAVATQFSIATGTLLLTNDAVTNANLRNSAGFSVIGKATTGTGDPADIVAGTNGVLRRSGSGDLGFGTLVSGNIGNDQITNALIRNSAALSVIGRSANSTGDPADIAAGTDAHVLRRSGTTLGFGQVATGGYTDKSVTYAKIQNVAANAVMCNPTGSAASPSEVSLSASQLLGRGASGNLAAIVLGTNLSMSGTTLNASGGSGSTVTLDVQTFTSSGTWTKPAGAMFTAVFMGGGGGGGGSGRCDTAGTRGGGGGGMGGCYSEGYFASSTLGATETVTIGAGGAGGTAVAVAGTNGNAGSTGGQTSFGAWLLATGGQGGGGGTTSGGGAAATYNASTTFYAFAQGQSAGQGGSTGVGGDPSFPFVNQFAAGSGAGGGGTNGTDRNGGTGSGGSLCRGGTTPGGAAGTGAGGAGAAGPAATSNVTLGGGGGGGASNSVGAGGAGGAGTRGGGGGGGGGGTMASGAGGNGGDGYVCVITLCVN